MQLNARARTALAASLVALTVTGCGDGGASGDRDTGPGPVEPLVGVWDLGDARNGSAARPALLVVRPVDMSGIARTALYESDTRDNCYARPDTSGRVEPDPAFRRDAFTRNVGAFDEGVLALVDGELVVDYTDTFDLDDDGDREERATFVAPPVALGEADVEAQRCRS